MVKRKAHFDSSDISSEESENSDLDSEFLNLAKKKKTKSKMDRSMTSFSEHSASENERQISSESSHEEFNDGYASDFMGDTEDRINLARMTEKEREQEIFKRIEAREVLKTRFSIEKKLRQAKRREMRKLKSIQDKKVERYFNAKERNRRAEENRGKKIHSSSKSRHDNQRDKHRLNDERTHSKTKLKASEVYSDDSGSSSDNDRARKKKQKSKKMASSDSSSDSETESRIRTVKLPSISTREQLNQIRLSRHKLEQIFQIPFFKRVVVGCYVRLVVGTSNDKPIYKICEVMDVGEDDTVYYFGGTKTSKTLHLRHGPHERAFRLPFISDQEFTDIEFQKWRKICILQGIPVPRVDQVQSKVRDIKEAILYGLKEEDIEKIIRRKERFRTNPHNYAIKKNQLMKNRDMAQSIGDIAKADEIQDELVELEKRTEEVEKLRAATISSIIYLNSRNRKKNADEPEKISIEVRTYKDQRVDDPFTRRHTKPTMVNRRKDPGKEDITPEATVIETRIEKAVELSSQTKKINPQKQGEEMYSAHDFDIKIEFDDTPPTNTSAPPVEDKVVKESSSKKSLNLEDYKKRKGLI